MHALTPELLLRAYAAGIFPMAESAEDAEIFWVDPERRGILPLDDFHLPARLARTLRQNIFEMRCDSDFAGVIAGCAQPTPDRPKTWINSEIVALYSALFASGFAHSIEAWQDGDLVGGLYGVSLGGAFFGESMFSRHRRQQGGAGAARRAPKAGRLRVARRAVRHDASEALRRRRNPARPVSKNAG